jgi:glyoxylase-like metal-dependent hydrolase (beta-lactamase superfamily II)
MSDLPTLTALDCGWLITQQRTLSSGGSTDPLRLPIPAWLVRHRRGDVVFDAGLHPGLADGPEGLGRRAKIFTPDVAHGGTVGPRLAEHDVDPAGPLTVVVSHCHFDHVGGLCELPNARLIVHADEWAAAQAEADAGFDRELYDLGHDVLTVDGAHDLFGDGTVVTVPTPGHTCGHQSLRVVTQDGPTILTADACYFSHTLDDGILPPFAFDEAQQRRSLAMLRRERDAGTRIVPGHDADAFLTLLAAGPR